MIALKCNVIMTRLQKLLYLGTGLSSFYFPNHSQQVHSVVFGQ